MTDAELAKEQQQAHDQSIEAASSQSLKEPASAPARNLVTVVLEWTAVSIPLIYGFWVTVMQAVKLFK